MYDKLSDMPEGHYVLRSSAPNPFLDGRHKSGLRAAKFKKGMRFKVTTRLFDYGKGGGNEVATFCNFGTFSLYPHQLEKEEAQYLLSAILAAKEAQPTCAEMLVEVTGYRSMAIEVLEVLYADISYREKVVNAMHQVKEEWEHSKG